jgi:hypothetical protein
MESMKRQRQRWRFAPQGAAGIGPRGGLGKKGPYCPPPPLITPVEEGRDEELEGGLTLRGIRFCARRFWSCFLGFQGPAAPSA